MPGLQNESMASFLATFDEGGPAPKSSQLQRLGTLLVQRLQLGASALAYQ